MVCLSKKGAIDFVFENIIFFSISLAFFLVMFLYVNGSLSNSASEEKVLAKQVALLLDNAGENMTFFVDVTNFYNLAKKNKYSGQIFFINLDSHEVMVKLRADGGYGMKYYTNFNFTYRIMDKGSLQYLFIDSGGAK